VAHASFLADDEISIRDSLAELMRREACEVDLAAGGLEAIAAIDRAIYDVVATDTTGWSRS
jgi:DNA-binding NtrC family response regulator